MKNNKIYNNIIKLFTIIILISFITFFIIFEKYELSILCNDYLNPYTITFKNPKTVQMFNIIVLYHYVMSFLIGIIVFTFSFIFLSFFRTYFFFGYMPKYLPTPTTFTEVIDFKNVNQFFPLLFNWISYNMLQQKFKNMEFYKKDIKESTKDQINHASTLEFLWVLFPALILVIIAYPSIVMLYYNEAYVDPLFNITVIGNQWYWTYEYNDFNLQEIFKKHLNNQAAWVFKALDKWSVWLMEKQKHRATDLIVARKQFDAKLISEIPRRVSVDCNMIIARDPKFLRLLTTDQCLVIPAKTPIRLMVTSNDVIHSWAVPSYGIKIDAVPGRINQQILNVPLVGTSWGQCSELCGVNHAYMPIEVKVLAFADFLFYMELRIKELLSPFFLKIYQNRIDIIKLFTSSLEDSMKKGIPFFRTFHGCIYSIKILRFSYVMFIVDAFPVTLREFNLLHYYRPILTPNLQYILMQEAAALARGEKPTKSLNLYQRYHSIMRIKVVPPKTK